MPTISRFYGITIRMYWTDHGPPHFHAIHGGTAAAFAIDDPDFAWPFTSARRRPHIGMGSTASGRAEEELAVMHREKSSIEDSAAGLRQVCWWVVEVRALPNYR